MAKLGELFIELGVAGDVKELEEAVNKMKEQVAVTQTQVRLDEARAKALEKIRQAQTKADKQRIAKAYNNEKTLIMQEAEVAATQRQIGAKRVLGGELAKLVTGFTAFVGAVAGAAYALNRLTNELVQSNQAFLDLTRTSDISLQTFQEWDSVGKMFGVQNAAQEISNLNDKLFNLMLTGEGARGFQLAGIDPRGQDAEGVMEQLRDRVATLDDTSASYLLRQMGIDPKMLHLLRMTREEFSSLTAEMKKYQLTPKQRRDIQLMNVQLQIAAQKLQYLKQRAILALMPVWVKFVQSFARVAEGFARIVKWVTSTKEGIIALAGAITTILIPAIYALYIAISSHPIVAAITAIFSTLYLLFDDIVGYFQGKNSMLGALLYALEAVNTELNSIETPKWVQDLLALIINIGNLPGQLSNLANIATGKENKVDISKGILKVGMNTPLMWGMGLVPGLIMKGVGTYAIAKSDAKELQNNIRGLVAGGASPPSEGYVGTLPDVSHNAIVSPATEQSINNNSVSNSNSNTTNITQNIEMHTNQPAQDTERELRYVASRYAYQ